MTRAAVLVSLLVGAVLVGLGAWWLFSAPETRSLPRAAPQDDLQMLAALTDGATSAPLGDVLVAGPAETYLARASDRTVLALPKTGGPPRTLARLDAPAWAMTLAEGTLWLTVRGQIVKVPLDHGGASVLSCGIGRPRAIAADAGSVFVVDVEPTLSGMTHASTIVRVRTTDGDTRVLGRSGGEVTNVAIDAASVYWADRLEGSIVVVPKDGGEAHTLVTDRGLPGSIAVAGDALVWIEKRSESIWTMPKTGGTPRQLAQDFAGFSNLAADGRAVFWTNEAAVDGAFRVFTVPVAGGDAAPVSAPVASIDAIATDGTRVFWDRGGEVSAVDAGHGAP